MGNFDGRTVAPISISADESRHALGAPGRLYCGRRIKDRAHIIGLRPRAVTCADCLAGLRADGVIE